MIKKNGKKVLLSLVCFILLTACSAPAQQFSTQTSSTSWLISRNAPAYTNNDDCAYPASLADDNSYDTDWISCDIPSGSKPMWLAYDLSHIPSSRRSRVLVVWYNETFNYDHTLIDDNAYDIPSTYTIDINPAPGGRKPPTSGWITRVTVTNNHYHSRQAIIDMANNNWLRINITASDGSPQNYYVSLNMDVFDASKGTADDFLFLGASITAGTMGHQTAAGTKSFAQLINARLPDRFPVEEDGGVATLTSGDAVQYINTWLPLFPGRYVGLSYGTNDALYCANPIDFYKNYVIMVRAIIKAGKVPIVSHISWSTNQNVQHCAPALNAQLDKLENAYPQVIKGPDFWALFRNHPELLADGIHPNDKGIALYRRAWANMVLTSIYHSSSTTA